MVYNQPIYDAGSLGQPSIDMDCFQTADNMRSTSEDLAMPMISTRQTAEMKDE